MPSCVVRATMLSCVITLILLKSVNWAVNIQRIIRN